MKGSNDPSASEILAANILSDLLHRQTPLQSFDACPELEKLSANSGEF